LSFELESKGATLGGRPFEKEISIGFILSPAGVLGRSVTITHVVPSHHKSSAGVGIEFSNFNHVIDALFTHPIEQAACHNFFRFLIDAHIKLK
jgi:hypothetical protein